MSAFLGDLNRDNQTPHGALRLVTELPFGDAQIRRYRMDNGLNILLLEDHSAPVVSYHTWMGVGSSHERPGKTGLAHLFEHLMFNESEGLPAGEFDRQLEAAGGEVNAATWTDWTYYYESVPASELPLVVRLEAERMARLVLRDPQVQSEKEVVANERRYSVDDDVEGSVSEVLFATAFERHPYGWPTIGWMKDIEGFTTEDCLAFYKTYYAPNNATLVVVGDFESEALLRDLQTHYGPQPSSDLQEQDLPVEPEQHTERVVELEKPTPTEKLLLGYRCAPLGHPDHIALTLANEILFGGKSSRLYGALVREGELASEARGSLTPFAHPGLYEIWVSMREGRHTDEALAIIEGELQRITVEGIEESELDKAKNRYELGFLQGMETAAGKAEQIGFHETVLGDARQVFAQLEAYRQTSPQAVQGAVARLIPARRTRVIVRPSEHGDGGEEATEAGDGSENGASGE